MEFLNSAVFLMFAAVIIFSSVFAVFVHKIEYCVLSAVVCFLSVGGLFLTLNADFIGVSQIMIYGVGVSILLVFAIMFTGKDNPKSLYLTNPLRIFLGFVFVLTFLSILIFFISPVLDPKSDGAFSFLGSFAAQIESIKQVGTAKFLGRRIFCDYVLPFELLSLLLLAGIVGVGYLAGGTKKDV